MESLHSIPKVLVATLMLGLLTNKATSEDNKREHRTPSSTATEKQEKSSAGRAPAEPLQIILVSVRDTPSSYPRGSEKCRVSGETRAGDPSLAILASQSIRTTQEAPTLYWYLSNATKCLVEVTLIETQTGETVVDATLMPPLSSGIHSVRLADYNQRLARGSQYAWSVSLVPEVDDRAKDIIVSVDLEYAGPTDTLRARLAGATRAATPSIYAEAGFSYDALAAILELTKETPNVPGLREQRRVLLEKVGLTEVIPENMTERSTLKR
jgi:hypothetical protein